MPFLSILHSVVDMALYHCAILPPVYAVVASVMFGLGWLTQVSIWAQCDNPMYENGGDLCFQRELALRTEGAGAGYLEGVSVPAMGARLILGCLVAIMYFVLLAFAAASIHKRRKQRRAVLPTK